MQVYGLEHSNGGLITFPGGVTLKDHEGAFIGSIGVRHNSSIVTTFDIWYHFLTILT